jgi:hypothetical protein
VTAKKTGGVGSILAAPVPSFMNALNPPKPASRASEAAEPESYGEAEELTKEEPQSAAQRPQLSQDQMERATEEALRRLRAEQAATQAATQK